MPYRGGAPALNDTIGGHVPISVLSVFQVLPLIQDGKLKPLAVTDLKRSAVLPNVQTVAEAGVANYEASLLFGLIAPAGMPPAVLAKINAEVTRIINAPEMQKKLAAQGVLPIASTPDEFTAVIKSRAGEVGAGHQGGEYQGVAGTLELCPIRYTEAQEHPAVSHIMARQDPAREPDLKQDAEAALRLLEMTPTEQSTDRVTLQRGLP